MLKKQEPIWWFTFFFSMET